MSNVKDDSQNAFKEYENQALLIKEDNDSCERKTIKWLIQHACTDDKAEISGRHSCYFDNPHDFSIIPFDFLEKTLRRKELQAPIISSQKWGKFS